MTARLFSNVIFFFFTLERRDAFICHNPRSVDNQLKDHMLMKFISKTSPPLPDPRLCLHEILLEMCSEMKIGVKTSFYWGFEKSNLCGVTCMETVGN